MTEIEPMQIATSVRLDEASSPLMSQNTDYKAIEYRLNNRKHMSDVGVNQTRTFAVELNNGAIIRVNVSSAQAEQFEQELSSAIAANPEADVGNLLYELTRFFDIYDVQWTGEFDDKPPVQEADALPPVDPVAGAEGGAAALDEPLPDDMGADMGGEEGDDEEAPFDDAGAIDINEPPEDDGLDPEQEVEPTTLTQLLQTIVSQLASDAEARKAEAEAKKSQADAEKAKAVAAAMEIRVGQETEKAEMEEWEDKGKEKDKKKKEMDRLAKFRLAKQQGIVDHKMIDANLKQLDEDWGSSDWSAALRMMANHIMQDGGTPSPESIRSAAQDAAEFYYEHMGYDNVEDAADRCEWMFNHRVKLQGIEAVMNYGKSMREAFSATPAARQEITRIGKALRNRPVTDERAFKTMQDAALDLVGDSRSTRAQGQRDAATARQSGADQKEISTIQQQATLKANFAKRIATLRQQLDAQLNRIAGGK